MHHYFENIAFARSALAVCIIPSFLLYLTGERGGLVVNASDSRSRGRAFEPHTGQTVKCP